MNCERVLKKASMRRNYYNHIRGGKIQIFFQFFQPGDAGAFKPYWGGKSLAVLKSDGAGYDAEKEDWYSFGLAMPSGKYTLAMVLTTPDMKKMSVAYCDVSLPAAETYQAALWLTEPVIVKALVAPGAKVEVDCVACMT